MSTAGRMLLAVPLAGVGYVLLWAAIGGARRLFDPGSVAGDVLGSLLVWVSPLALGWLVLIVLWAACVLLLGRVRP